MIRFLHGFEQNSGGTRSLPEKKWGDGVPPRPRPTTPLFVLYFEFTGFLRFLFVLFLYVSRPR